MDRRIVASGLAVAAGGAIVAAQVVGLFDASPSFGETVLFVGGLIIAAAIPVIGAILVMRRRPEGVAVLVTAALIALPAIMSVGYFLVPTLSRGSSDQTAMIVLYLAAQLATAGAGLAAWGLRDAARWRWNRPVPAPVVALGVVALLPAGALLVTMHGVLFPIAMFVNLNVVDLAMLAQFLVVVGLLVWATRLPRRTAAVVLLVLLVPRLYESLAIPLSGDGFGGFATDPLSWLGPAAEAAIIGTAVWWLTRDDDVEVQDEPVEPGTPVTGPLAG